jgi:hypothetical protein
LQASNEDSFEPLARFAEEWNGRAVGSYTYDKGKTFLDGTTPEPSASHSP